MTSNNTTRPRIQRSLAHHGQIHLQQTHRYPTIYHQLKQTQNSQLSSSTTGTHSTNIRNATTTRKPTTGTFPTTTNIKAQSTNDNNPVNHQPIRHSKRLESQRRMSELDIKTPDTS